MHALLFSEVSTDFFICRRLCHTCIISDEIKRCETYTYIYSLDLYQVLRSMAQEACTSTKAEGEAEGTSKSTSSESDHKIVTETEDEEISTLKKKIHV